LIHLHRPIIVLHQKGGQEEFNIPDRPLTPPIDLSATSHGSRKKFEKPKGKDKHRLFGYFINSIQIFLKLIILLFQAPLDCFNLFHHIFRGFFKKTLIVQAF